MKMANSSPRVGTFSTAGIGCQRSAVSGQPSATERSYTSQIKDTETQLYYYNARHYDPALGVFISPDRADDSLNRYAYVYNNPLKYVDPNGEHPLLALFGALALAAGVAAVGALVIGGMSAASGAAANHRASNLNISEENREDWGVIATMEAQTGDIAEDVMVGATVVWGAAMVGMLVGGAVEYSAPYVKQAYSPRGGEGLTEYQRLVSSTELAVRNSGVDMSSPDAVAANVSREVLSAMEYNPRYAAATMEEAAAAGSGVSVHNAYLAADVLRALGIQSDITVFNAPGQAPYAITGYLSSNSYRYFDPMRGTSTFADWFSYAEGVYGTAIQYLGGAVPAIAP